jgi:hypothetical protein
VGVAILAAEGSGRYKERIRAARIGAIGDNDEIPVCYLGDVPDMGKLENVKAMTQKLQDLDAYMQQVYRVRLGVVMLDTLSASVRIEDENSASVAAGIIKNLKQLSKDTKSLVIAIHHHGKNGDGTLRGSSAWTDNCDTIITVTAYADGTREAELVRHKDAAKGLIASFRLEFTQLGEYDTGEPFGACFVSDIETTAVKREKKGDKSKSDAKDAFDTAMANVTLVPYQVPNGPVVDAVKYDDALAEFRIHHVTGSQKESAITQAFGREISKAGKAGVWVSKRFNNVQRIWRGPNHPDLPILNDKPQRHVVENCS